MSCQLLAFCFVLFSEWIYWGMHLALYDGGDGVMSLQLLIVCFDFFRGCASCIAVVARWRDIPRHTSCVA